MNTTIFIEFDKIIILKPSFFTKNEFGACYSTLPHADYLPGALEHLLECRRKGYQIILLAHGNERIIKEVLWKLHACHLFDQLIIPETN